MGFFDLFRKKTKDVYTYSNDLYHYKGAPENYFSELFVRYFPEYTIKRNVQMSPVSGNSVPVSFMFEKDGHPVLAVILCYSQEYNRKHILTTIQVCESNRIPVQRYFVDFRNEETYVCQRIRMVLLN